MAQGFDFLAVGVDFAIVDHGFCCRDFFCCVLPAFFAFYRLALGGFAFLGFAFYGFPFDDFCLADCFFIGVGVVFVDEDFFFLACFFVCVICSDGLVAVAAGVGKAVAVAAGARDGGGQDGLAAGGLACACRDK